MIDYIIKMVEENPAIIIIENGLAEGDWEGWQKLYRKLGDKIQFVGDDLFVTNIDLEKKRIQLKNAKLVLIKVNQIGTLTKTLDTIRLAQKMDLFHWLVIILEKVEDILLLIYLFLLKNR